MTEKVSTALRVREIPWLNIPQIRAKDYSNTTLQLTSRLLGRNAEYYTIWNHRRLILSHVFISELKNPKEVSVEDAAAAQKAGLTPAQNEISLLIKEDLGFLVPLLKQYPKCYWIWNHRSWLLRTATEHLSAHATLELWQGELALVSKMLALDSRNFHGWGYRREVVRNIERVGSLSMVEREFDYSSKMINSNLSNFSAWHYRSQLIPRLLLERNADSEARRKLFNGEFELITRALYTDPYDQSLWFYHQYLMSTLDLSNSQSSAILDPCSNEDRIHYLEQELDSVKDMLDGAEDCKYIYQALLEYSRRYREIDAGTKKITMLEMEQWLSELQKLDPLRSNRWKDFSEVHMSASARDDLDGSNVQ